MDDIPGSQDTELSAGACEMEQIEDLNWRLRAFQASLNRLLNELGVLAPLQRRLVKDSEEIAKLKESPVACDATPRRCHDAA